MKIDTHVHASEFPDIWYHTFYGLGRIIKAAITNPLIEKGSRRFSRQVIINRALFENARLETPGLDLLKVPEAVYTIEEILEEIEKELGPKGRAGITIHNTFEPLIKFLSDKKRYTQEHQEGLRQKCGRGAGVFS